MVDLHTRNPYQAMRDLKGVRMRGTDLMGVAIMGEHSRTSRTPRGQVNFDLEAEQRRLKVRSRETLDNNGNQQVGVKRPEKKIKYTEEFILVNTPKNFQKIGTPRSVKLGNRGRKTESQPKDTPSSD
jgi:hypothetical protein